jgi:peptidoglycan/xylan/chitin deacetylase (PgdA/CDA1 family)
MLYFVKTPWLVKKYVYPEYIWDLPGKEKKIYLTFDDGPHPEATPLVLNELNRFNAKATFFCIGKNVASHPDIYKRLILEGHSIGNHTHNHLNGRDTGDAQYLKDIHEASKFIDSSLFRPPYGRITGFQAKQVMEKLRYRIIMWTVLSGDFDARVSGEDCLQNVLKATRPGSIIVFHDSEKALKKVGYALPKMLEQFKNQGYSFDRIEI